MKVVKLEVLSESYYLGYIRYKVWPYGTVRVTYSFYSVGAQAVLIMQRTCISSHLDPKYPLKDIVVSSPITTPKEIERAEM